MAKRHERFPSNYLAKEDFPKPILATVFAVKDEEVQVQQGKELKPVLYIHNPSSPVDTSKGIILNGTNWDAIAEISGRDDDQEWMGTQIVLYHEPNVMFGRERVGGIRIRAPRVQAQAPPVPMPEPDPEPESPAASDEPIYEGDSPF